MFLGGFSLQSVGALNAEHLSCPGPAGRGQPESRKRFQQVRRDWSEAEQCLTAHEQDGLLRCELNSMLTICATYIAGADGQRDPEAAQEAARCPGGAGSQPGACVCKVHVTARVGPPLLPFTSCSTHLMSLLVALLNLCAGRAEEPARGPPRSHTSRRGWRSRRCDLPSWASVVD